MRRRVTRRRNPAAAREIEFQSVPAGSPKRIAVVGAGPAGLSCAVAAAERGHAVTLYDSAREIGGQLNLARAVPGKEEFNETLRYFRRRLETEGVELRLGQRVEADALIADGYDEIVVATGVSPRLLDIDGADHPMVVSYVDVLSGAKTAGQRVVVVGAGGIGFDVAQYLTARHGVGEETVNEFLAAWGVDVAHRNAGGVAKPPAAADTDHAVTMLQRKPARMGRSLGLTTGWVPRTELPRRGVEMITGAAYRLIDDAGLHITVENEERLIAADTIVVCAGQEPDRGLHQALVGKSVRAHLIGGAEEAAELDAMRAIDQGTRLGLAL